MTTLRVLQAGHATLQDLGRPGFAALGVPAGGAADHHAARTANVLVGNADATPLIEITASGLAIRADQHLLVAVTGAATTVLVGGAPCPSWELLLVPAGVEVEVPAPAVGLRSYLAIGGFDHPRTLGSVAPDPLLGIANALVEGDLLRPDLPTVSLPQDGMPFFRLDAAHPGHAVRPGDGVGTVAVTAGPDLHLLVGGADRLEQTFTVGSESNQVGLRLDGPALDLAGHEEILSRGVPVGAVEVPPSGGVITLLRARLVTAGYPVVAIATTLALDVLGQLRPGDRLRFTVTTVDDAVAALRDRERARHALAMRVRRALVARGLGAALSPLHASSRECPEGPGTSTRPLTPLASCP